MAEISKISSPSLSSLLPHGQITGQTAGEALGAWDWVYLKSDGKLYKATGAAASAPAQAVGLVPRACAAGETGVTIYFGDVTVNYGSGLAPGASVYLSGTVAGGIADAASTGGTRKLGVVMADGARIRFFSTQGT